MLALAAGAVADEVVVKGLKYSDAKITGVKDWQIQLDTNTGTSVSKPLDAVGKITVTGQDSFNQAEAALAGNKFAEAVKAYDQALDRGRPGLAQATIIVRRLRALGQAGMIDRAVNDWLDLVKDNGTDKFVLGLRPGKCAPKRQGQRRRHRRTGGQGKGAFRLLATGQRRPAAPG